MSSIPIVDSHHHFWWNPTEDEYPWMEGDFAGIRRTLGPDDLRTELSACGVTRTVLVQTRSSIEETQKFLDLAAHTPFIAGVVGWVDLTQINVATIIDDLRQGPGGDLLVGIRHQVHDEPDPNWLARGDVIRGLRSLGEAALPYDLLVRTRELPSAYAVAKKLPRVRFVVDHLAKPSIRTGESDSWATSLAPFSDLRNVSCKLSGMVTEANWSTWIPDDLTPYVERVAGWFGSDRLMFGSDWPVCLLAASYTDVFNAYHTTVNFLSTHAQDMVFGGNALRFYGLEAPRHGSADESPAIRKPS